MVRFGGSDEVNYQTAPNGTTATAEAFVAGVLPGTGAWIPAQSLPNPVPGVLPDGRYLAATVVLPDASILVLGGSARLPNGPNVSVNQPILYRNGQWTVLPPNPVQSVRDYHCAAVLLPDGRVMIGGGNSRTFDYEFFLPDYLQKTKPQQVSWSGGAPPVDFDTGAFQLSYNS